MAKDNYTLGTVQTQPTGRGPRGGRPMEKAKDAKKAWRETIHYCRPYLVWFALAFTAALISVLLTLFAPNQLSRITDLISDGMEAGVVDTARILHISILVGLFYIFSALLSFTKNFTLRSVTEYIMNRLRRDIDHKLNRVPLRRFDSASFGDLLIRVTNDVDTLGMSLSMALGNIVGAIFEIAGSCVMMLLTNPLLGLTAILASIIGFVGMNLIIKRSQKYFKARQYYLGMLNGHIEEMYAGHDIVKAFSGEDEALKTFDEYNEKLYSSNLMSQFLSSIMQPLMVIVGDIGYVAVCVVGAIMVSNHMISFGVIVAFIIYVKMFTQPLSMLAQSMTELQSAAAAAERIFDFLGEEEMADESQKTARLDPDKVRGEVEFSHVKFGYTPDRTIIHDFSLKVKPGQKVAIVGPTGAGKTTIVNLLMRFYELDDGSISIDGVKTSDLTRENVHALFCMVLQDSWLFEGTVKENIVYSMKNVPDEKVIEACKSVGLDHFIRSLPKDYDTPLSDESNLSVGQKQLMTIARAMVEDAPLLILDEATSSVDTRTEQQVQWAMEKLTEGRTSFTIAHRLSTIRNSDVIIVMKDGDIIETGSHDELLEKGGFYHQLWNSQFVNAETI